MNRLFTSCVIGIVLMSIAPVHAVVKYDEGRRVIGGVQLLQDNTNPSEYYYLPQFPRLATRDDGTFQFLCLKYVGEQQESSGGLFHALIEFSLPQQVLDSITGVLQQESPSARIVGPVPLLQPSENDQSGVGGFEVVSAVLSQQDGESSFTRSMITSGHAPLAPGSRAAVAALLNRNGATLLWESLSGPTSDVSVSIHAYYEAAVKAYNAVVEADMQTVYQHFSRVMNVAHDYTKRQVRNVVDQLKQDGNLRVEVYDRTSGLGISAAEMEGILSIVTDKLTELLFDAKTGWSKEPERVTAVEANQIQGRQKRGWFARVFGGSGDTKYFTDDQYVLKRTLDTRAQSFRLNLSKATTIRVPLHTSGNIGGLYDSLKNDPKYFRIVDMGDPSFQRREIHFQIDGGVIDCFEDVVNSVTVSFRKTYPEGHHDVTKDLIFHSHDVRNGRTIDSISFPRLAMQSADWIEFEYRVHWSLLGEDTMITVPERQDEWIKSTAPAVSLVPPFEKRMVEIDADRAQFGEAGYSTAEVVFATRLAGKPKLGSSLRLRASDSEQTSRLAVYHDRDKEVVYRVKWYSTEGTVSLPVALLEGDYIFLTPPADTSNGSN